ncbi:MAG TPA: SPFH domain-containing protein [Sedimentisphaerales bacterium]|nr:SPFH domain-containing protein [Sedimentisphaerales bacterium]
MKISPKRAEYLSIIGLVLGLLFFGAVFAIGRWSGSHASGAAAWQILSSAIVWFVLLIQFHQRVLTQREKLDLAQLAKASEDHTIFETEQQEKGLFAVHHRRLELLEKWFLPILASLIAAYQITMGLLVLRRVDVVESVSQPLVIAVYMATIAFVSFLFSRYATGMSSEEDWKPLRAGGGFLAVNAAVCFVLAVGYALAQFKSMVLLEAMHLVIPITMLVLGVEIALNVLLDMYRPRIVGRYHRAAFDSRLLSLVNEPGAILQTVAGTIDYQFGFKVSQTWFYKLLAKAILPLLLFSALTLYLLSSIVVVRADEEAIIERFGRPINNGEPIGPGLTLKWPWPIDVAHVWPTRRIQHLTIGFDREDETKVYREPLLWNRPHYKEERNLLVANRAAATTQRGGVPFSIIVADVPVQFRVRDLYAFLYNYGFERGAVRGTVGRPVAVSVLESISYRELVKHAASSNSTQRPEAFFEGLSMLGADRAAAAEILKQRIQQRADEAQLGVEIVFVGVQVHPPTEVAADYADVVGAVLDKRAAMLDAVSERSETLGLLAGSVSAAEELGALVRRSQAGAPADPADPAELDRAFGAAGGDIFSILRQSRSQAYERIAITRATGERFQSQLEAFRAAPEIYKREMRLGALEEMAPSLRKYVVVTDPEDARITIIDVSERAAVGLHDFTTVEPK